MADRAIETSVLPAPRRYDALDSLRGIAACWVFLFHVPSDGNSWPLPIVQNGFLAVTFFFILSGFVIGASYADRLTQGYPIGKFMFLRWGRIYPLHAFVLLVMIAYEIVRGLLGIDVYREGAAFTGQTAIPTLIGNIFMLQGLLPEHSWNGPSWTVSVEFWTYMISAMLLYLLRLKRLLPTGIILIIPGALVAMLGNRLPFDVPFGLAQLLSCCLGFGIGLCVYEMRQHGLRLPENSRNRLSATAIEAITIALVLWLSWTYGGRLSLLIYPAFALMIWVFSSQVGFFSRLLITPPMLLLGTLSYSIYMVHHFVQDRILDAIGGQLIPLPLTVPEDGRIVLSGSALLCDVVTLTMLAITLLVAYLTYHYVEDPARRWSREVAKRMSPNTTDA